MHTGQQSKETLHKCIDMPPRKKVIVPSETTETTEPSETPVIDVSKKRERNSA